MSQKERDQLREAMDKLIKYQWDQAMKAIEPPPKPKKKLTLGQRFYRWVRSLRR